MSSASSSSRGAPTHRDYDCAQMARQALFPKQINRDGTHSTLFPAAEALTKIREDAMTADPNRAPSSFFPKRVVVVREIGHDTLKWNGQPDIEDKDASFEVIPSMLSVKCMQCAHMPKGVHAFFTSQKDGEKEITLCSDRLIKSDYKPSTGAFLDIPPRSYAALEEALAHQVTLVGNQLECNRGGSDPTTNEADPPSTSCKGMAVSEIKAARAAECYYNKSENEVKRGSCLPLGYSLLPTSLQTTFLNRCIRSVATKAVTEKFGSLEGKQCVEEALNEVGKK